MHSCKQPVPLPGAQQQAEGQLGQLSSAALASAAPKTSPWQPCTPGPACYHHPPVIVSNGCRSRLPSASSRVYITPRVTWQGKRGRPDDIVAGSRASPADLRLPSAHLCPPGHTSPTLSSHLVVQTAARRIYQEHLHRRPLLLEEAGHPRYRAAGARAAHKCVDAPARLLPDLPPCRSRRGHNRLGISGNPAGSSSSSSSSRRLLPNQILPLAPLSCPSAHLSSGGRESWRGSQTGRRKRRWTAQWRAGVPR